MYSHVSPRVFEAEEYGLSDPNGSLSDAIPSWAIAQANCEVAAELVSSRYSFGHMSYDCT